MRYKAPRGRCGDAPAADQRLPGLAGDPRRSHAGDRRPARRRPALERGPRRRDGIASRLAVPAPAGTRERLQADGLQGWAAFVGRPYHWEAWSALEDGVRTGENAFGLVHGTNPWEYRAARPEESAVFDRAMTALTRPLNRALLDAYDFGRFRKVMDVGGGTGALLAAVLAEYPALQGVLFDQPHVVAGADALLGAAGVADRCRIVGGS